ncbi:MAG: ATP-binding cassette domain-containing protein [Methanosarcinales archaeon]|nr:MAG: ATP-binding cassette domain-containing protein [Methanosarcinales archaeon]
MADAIEINGLTKVFDGLVAVDHVSINIAEGELFGLLGPNGAGKTTLIKMLATLLMPTSGTAKVSGYDVTKDPDKVRRCIGIIFQDPSLDNRLTGKENLDFHARMYGMDRELREKRMDEVLDLVELKDKANILVENYSGGMKRRLEIARGLMHHPEVLFLDEPTLGLDPQTRRHIWEYIRNLNKKEDITIILTTHYIEEADYLCDRVAIIDYGKIVALDAPKNLKDTIGADIVSLEISDSVDKDFVAMLGKFKWIKKMKEHDGFLDLSVKNGETRIPELMNIAQKAGVVVQSVSLRKPTLEDVFLHYVGKTIREEETSVKDQVRERMRRRWHN